MWDEGIGPRPWLVVNNGHNSYSNPTDPALCMNAHTHAPLLSATPSALAPSL